MKRENVRDTFDKYSGSYADAVYDSLVFPELKSSHFIAVKADYLTDISRRAFAHAKAMSVLDVGCGTGGFHAPLEGVFRRLSGVDISEDSLDFEGTAHLHVDYVHYDGSALPWGAGSFDIVFSSCVFNHIPLDERAGVLREAVYVLKPEDHIVIFEHNTRNPLTRKVITDCALYEDAVMLRPRELEALYEEAGLQTSEQRTILSTPPVVALARALDKGLGRPGLGAQYYAVGQRR